jgi:hypothetical protein
MFRTLIRVLHGVPVASLQGTSIHASTGKTMVENGLLSTSIVDINP